MAPPCSADVMSPAAHAPYSFSAAAGPLPAEVAAELAEACRPRRGEIPAPCVPFTSAAYRRLQEETEASLRRLLGIPQHFRVLFMHGGASTQFALVPLNLANGRRLVAYVDSGHWSRRAMAEAARYAEVAVVAQARDGMLPEPSRWRLDPRAAYCHITTNETADGLQLGELPAIDVPLAADMSSDLLTRPLDFSRIGVAYAAAQKNLGVAGLTVVIVREDLLGRAHPATPRVMNYAAQAEADSRLNTPPVLAMTVTHRMLRWTEANGGIDAMAHAAARRSGALYAALDGSGGFYRCPVATLLRSRINPCFRLADPDLTERFLEEAAAAGLTDLRGHPQVGGVRVSFYNGVDDAAVAALISFVEDFARRRG